MQGVTGFGRLLNQVLVPQGEGIAVGHHRPLAPLASAEGSHKGINAVFFVFHQQNVLGAADLIKAKLQKHLLVVGLCKEEQMLPVLLEGLGAQGGNHSGRQALAPPLFVHGDAFEHIFLQGTGGGHLSLPVIQNHGVLDTLVIAQSLAGKKFLHPAAHHTFQSALIGLLQKITLHGLCPPFSDRKGPMKEWLPWGAFSV